MKMAYALWSREKTTGISIDVVNDDKWNPHVLDFILQDYLSLKLPVNITRELTKLRWSSHPVLIEKGRYFRPKIKRENQQFFQLF
jgi:hypothetical protein